jgi:hypothetical protein
MDYGNQPQNKQLATGGIMGIPGTVAMQDERQPHIVASLMSIEARVDQIGERIGTLSKRIDAILRPSAPISESGNKEAKRPQTGVGLADMLDLQADKLQFALDYLNDILRRVEL